MRDDLHDVVSRGKRFPRKRRGLKPVERRRKHPSLETADAATRRGRMARHFDDTDWGYAHFLARHNALTRTLQRRVGEPWDAVYSELCRSLGSDRRLRRYLDRFIAQQLVALNVWFVDGQPWTVRHWEGERSLKPGELYVCPKTGRLQRCCD